MNVCVLPIGVNVQREWQNTSRVSAMISLYDSNCLFLILLDPRRLPDTSFFTLYICFKNSLYLFHFSILHLFLIPFSLVSLLNVFCLVTDLYIFFVCIYSFISRPFPPHISSSVTCLHHTSIFLCSVPSSLLVVNDSGL